MSINLRDDFRCLFNPLPLTHQAASGLAQDRTGIIVRVDRYIRLSTHCVSPLLLCTRNKIVFVTRQHVLHCIQNNTNTY